MATIDLITYEDNLVKRRLSRYLSKPKTYLLLSTYLLPILTGAILCTNIPIYASPYIFIKTTSNLKKEWQNLRIEEKNTIIEKIKNSEEYKKWLELYDSFLLSIAKLIKSTELKEPMEVIKYIEILLKEGYFSLNHHYEYKNYMYNNEYLTELCGARVVSGTGTCRHASSFIADILNTLGYNAVVQIAAQRRNDKESGKIEYNHTINVIEDNGSLIYYDFINKDFLRPINEEPDEICKLLEPTSFIGVHFITRPGFNLDNYRLPNRQRDLRRLKTKQLNEEEIFKSTNKALAAYLKLLPLEEEFSNVENERKESLYNLTKKLAPYSDKKITTWQISQ